MKETKKKKTHSTGVEGAFLGSRDIYIWWISSAVGSLAIYQFVQRGGSHHDGEDLYCIHLIYISYIYAYMVQEKLRCLDDLANHNNCWTDVVLLCWTLKLVHKRKEHGALPYTMTQYIA